MSASSKKRVALLVNQIPPYRSKMFGRLAERFDLTILHGGMESNRPWKHSAVEGARDRKVAGWTLIFNRRQDGRVLDRRFLHIEPGYVTELLRLHPTAIVTAEIGFRTLVALAYGAIFRIPVWVWWGGTLHTERQVKGLRNALRKFAAGRVKHWISYGVTSTEYLHSLGVSGDRILQVQNCVDEALYSNASRSAVELTPKPVLLYVGRFVAGKGIVSLLRAAARAQARGMQFSLLLVGDGPDREALTALASDLRLCNLRFYPAQPAEGMPAIYRSADVLIFPTLSDVWGLVANEAVLSGLPVLCSTYAGCAPELFDPDCIFDPTSDEEFANALEKAINGNLPRSDASRLVPIAAVGDAIADAVLNSIRS